MDYKDGDTITVNGKPCRIEGSALVPVVQRGPLGGELKRLADLKEGEHFVVRGYVHDHNRCDPDEFKTKVVIGSDDFMSFYDDLPQNVEVETNIPPRPAFTPMSAGEALLKGIEEIRWCCQNKPVTELGKQIEDKLK